MKCAAVSHSLSRQSGPFPQPFPAVLKDLNLLQGDKAAAHHAIENRQEIHDIGLGVDDLHDDGKIER